MKTILITNRGEIAVRLIRTVQRLGYRALAVYSDPDTDAKHVQMADYACRIGSGPATDSYLNREAILTAALSHAADAVHPGYGFLAENAEFAQAVLDAGLIWIGPPPEAMRTMGNKAAAKRLLADRHVPLLPGYHDNDQGDDVLKAEAARIGFPLMIKAAAGGGGRGMRLVRKAHELASNLIQARSEAQQAFGSSDLILERALLSPRHVEVQVFADTQGNVVHLGERDCSVQRRYQKLIEEAPSPAVSSTLRHRLGAAAVEATRSCGYVGAGTIEFLLDADDTFWFMEMNTRLQVEHTVTEAITGLDLVEWQLRVAAGEDLPLTQKQIDVCLLNGGHAIEARLCAEDPTSDFLPQAGQIIVWRPPSQLRVEHALADGQVITPFYDSMLAKLIVHAPNREEARRKLMQQLDRCVLLGLPTNQDFLLAVLSHAKFSAGLATTGFIKKYFPKLRAALLDEQPLITTLALGVLLTQRSALQTSAYPDELRGWSSCIPFDNTLACELDGVVHTLSVRPNGADTWEVLCKDRVLDLVVRTQQDAHQLRLHVDGSDHEIPYGSGGDEVIHFRALGRNHTVRDLTYQAVRQKNAASGDGRLCAPINGRVASLAVQTGESVQAGQPLIVLEAMKMEHALLAPHDGVVATLYVTAGEQVAPGKLLVELVSL